MASSLSQSYEKIFLVIAIIAAVGLGTVVFLQAKKLDAKYTTQSLPKQEAPKLPGEKVINDAVKSLGQEKDWPAAKLEKDSREVDMFTGIAWFLRKGEDLPVDLLAPGEQPVHGDIPNRWWIDNALDPGYADSADRDPDKDGFSNAEEFAAQTDPNNFKEHPPLGSKLRLADLETVSFLLTFSSEIGDNKYQFKYEDTKRGANKSDYIGRGDSFFTTAPGLQRFRVKDVFEEEVTNERTNTTSKVKFATVEDLAENKAGRIYKLKRGMRSYEKQQYIQRDYTAVLELAAIGQGGVQFRVPENSRFSLPFDENATEKPFHFKEVRNGDTVVIEWEENGETKSLDLRKPGA